jgi:hypothetical protein
MNQVMQSNGQPYTTKCDMTSYGGGWTRFLKLSSTCPNTNFGGIPESQEFVDSCNGEEYTFSRAQMIAGGGQIMARQVDAPHKAFIMEWPTTCSGEKFFKIVTGDYSRDSACFPRMWDFSANAWVASGDGWCNVNSHTQFNCVAQAYGANSWPAGAVGLRFHWGARDTMNDGGNTYSGAWNGWTGWVGSYGSDSSLVDNFDSWSGKVATEVFYRPGGLQPA